MTEKKKRSFSSQLFWRIFSVFLIFILGISVFYHFQTPKKSQKKELSDIEASKISRANYLTKSSENQIVEDLVSPINDLIPRLSDNNSDDKIEIQSWLKSQPNVLAVTLWNKNDEWPTRILKDNFWDLAPVKQITPDRRQTLFSFIFQNTYDHMKPLYFGDLLPETFFGKPAISATKLLDHPSLTAIRLHILIENIEETIQLPLDSLESFSIIDPSGKTLFSIQNQNTVISNLPNDNSFQWQPQSIYILRDFQNLPWKSIYHAVIPNELKPASTVREFPLIYPGILLLVGLILSLIITHSVSSPIKKMSKKATFVSQGIFHEIIDPQSNRDFDQIARILNYMAHEMERVQEMNVSEIISEKIKTETILRNIADGVIVTDSENHVLVINRVAETWFGFSEKEMSNRRLEQFIHVDSLSNLIDRVKNSKSKLTAEFPYIPFNASEAKVFQAHSSSVFNKNGSLIGVVTAIRDVTREREVDRIKTELVSMVAHELKSPLTSIFGFSELLLESDLKDPQLVEYAHIIMTESSRLTDLVNKFLDLTRLESGRTEIKMNPFELGSVVEKVLESHQQQTDKKSIKVIQEIPPDLPLVMGDQDMIEQVLLNLLSNAVKYSPKRSKVGIEAKEENGKVLVSVIDNGYGIPKESLQHIFDKFYRVSDSATDNEIEGSGLGLTLAREIIQHHGGEIKVQSRLGVGSVFSFTLPKADV